MSNPQAFKVFFLIGKGSLFFFLPRCFPDFFFVFSIQKINYDVSQTRFLWIYFVWGSLSFLNLQVYISLSNLGRFQSLFLKMLFQFHPPSLLRFWWRKCKIFFNSPTVPDSLFSFCFFFSIDFLCCSYWIISCPIVQFSVTFIQLLSSTNHLDTVLFRSNISASSLYHKLFCWGFIYF